MTASGKVDMLQKARRKAAAQVGFDTDSTKHIRQIRHGILLDTKQSSPNCTRQALLLVFAGQLVCVMLVSMKMQRVPQAGRTPVGRAAARANERWEETASELPKVSQQVHS